MYIYIKRYFEMGLYKIEDMKVFVVSAMITADQFKEITGEEYAA
ncbi:XkdX family protein [Lapidilactobacillus bayanensis]|nr:XkdX family protein [Lapidilactobacillus bayanensis]